MKKYTARTGNWEYDVFSEESLTALEVLSRALEHINDIKTKDGKSLSLGILSIISCSEWNDDKVVLTELALANAAKNILL